MDKILQGNNKYNRPQKCEKCSNENMENIGIGRYKCTECGHIMMDDYGKARNYIEKNKGATAFEVVDATGVSINNIRRMINEGKLMIVSDNRYIHLRCKGCGQIILEGILCEECKKKKIVTKKNSIEKSDKQLHGTIAQRRTQKGKKRFI